MGLLIRPTRLEDGAEAYGLVKVCPGMDLNSLYAYLMLCKEFSRTSRMAFLDDRPIGYVCGFRPPERPQAVFVWQIVVSPDAQGTGVGGKMLHDLAAVLSQTTNPISYVEATVAEDNQASRGLFGGLAKRLGAPLREEPYIVKSHFGGHGHPAEPLIRVGPFTKIQS